MVHIPGIYTFGGEAEIPQILVKSMKKSNFHRDFDQKISTVSLSFKILLIFGPNAQNFKRRFLNFPCLVEIIHRMLISLNYSTN